MMVVSLFFKSQSLIIHVFFISLLILKDFCYFCDFCLLLQSILKYLLLDSLNFFNSSWSFRSFLLIRYFAFLFSQVHFRYLISSYSIFLKFLSSIFLYLYSRLFFYLTNFSLISTTYFYYSLYKSL